jgi:tetratricopeptide (TPR) repeat protein
MRSQRTTGADPESLANSYLLLSRIYWKLGNTAESANALNLAEEQYQLANSEVGSGLLELDRATIFFRTHQFSRARESLIKARDIFEKTNEPVFLASTLNVMSRLDRVDPSLAAYEEVGYDEADRRGREALQVLDNRDWFVAAELNLTLCILHYAWGLKLINKGQKEEADEHFKLSSDFNRQGLDKIEQIDSPMLYSIYRGMQANLAIQAGDQKTAAEHFLNELMSATQTKHMRLLRALDLLESWLVSMPPGETDRIGQWLVKNWRKKGLSNNFPQVEEAIQQVADYRSYIPNTV